MAIAELAAGIVAKSEEIGKQAVKIEELRTALKTRKNAIHPDGSRFLTSEEALKEPESSVGLDVKILISDYWTVFNAGVEMERARDMIVAQLKEEMRKAEE